MTQPPLSRQIQKLEAAIGAPLLDRGPRGVTLTPAGAKLLTEARRLLAAAAAAAVSARQAVEGATGLLSVGFTATAALGPLGGLLADAEELIPGVEIALREMVTSEQLARLDDRSLDLGLVRPIGATTGFASRAVHRERLVAALHVEHPLAARRDAVRTAELEGAHLIGYSSDHARYFSDLVSALLVNVPVRSSLQVSHVHSMIALVAARRGVALVPESVVSLHHADVVFRELADWQAPVVALHAAWSPDNTNPALHRAVERLPSLQPVPPMHARSA